MSENLSLNVTVLLLFKKYINWAVGGEGAKGCRRKKKMVE